MARNTGNSKRLPLILLVASIFLLASGATAFVLLRKPSAFANLPAFPIDSYLAGRNLLGLEDYKIEGRVDNILLRSATGEKLLVAIQPVGSDLRLPIIVEKKGGKSPIQREQNLVFRVNLGSLSQIRSDLYEPK